ncbi:hypothetical protein IKF20_00485 [Candidatus Saccharibacteria bacterium]|nr:hypothetical protein [Candidatus Saccharibacteria bacterium]
MTKKETAKKTKKDKAETKTGKKMSRKTLWTIIGSIIGGLTIVGVIIGIVISNAIENQPLEEDWAQTYYVYLDEHHLDPQLKDSNGKIEAEANEYSVEFYDVEGVDNPVMAVNYVTDDTNYLTYYWITEEGVRNSFYFSPSSVELLYNIEQKKSDYYIHSRDEKGNVDYYSKLGEDITSASDSENPNHVKTSPKYRFEADDVDTVTDKDGKDHSLTKFEQTFVKVEDDTQAKTLPVDYEEKELKSTIKEGSYEYQALQEVAEKHAQMIREMVDSMEKRVAEMDAVKKENAEIEAAKKADEEKKRREEEAKKGIRLDNKYTIAYGTYRMDDDVVGADFANQNKLVLKPNGACTYGGKACTWKKERHDFTQSAESTNVHEALRIGNGTEFYALVYAYGNNELGDGDIEHFTRIGN